MDSGGYKFIFNEGNYQILEEDEYFAVDYHYKQIAAFKTKIAAFEYVLWKLKGC